ncbi:hypothetical protein [Xanthomonas graminis]|uniref:hypothetical protein n=1 Tax=Xanthomonas graminis TaxID=3390026 RepID=UPI001F2881A2|nr:hypothetical protein [Xanthomonas translucens]UKE73247.1 hypothetical protein KFS85_19930 [Xanthomonas translucens pv. phleipratensis]
MRQTELPQLRADQIEWDLLAGNSQEYSRGDLQADRAFNVPVDAQDAYDPAPGVGDARAIDDCFDHIEYRAGVFNDGYAFSVEDDVITKIPGEETDAQLVYRFLLACSRTELSKTLSLQFSELCKLSLQRLLGAKARVWNVDVGSADRVALGGSTRNVAESVAKYLGAHVHAENLDDLPVTGGDGGADLIATFGFEDSATGSICLLGQCAASSTTDYWRDKIHQPSRFASLFHFSAGEPVLVTFIPVVYRKANGKWLDHNNVVKLLFDRIRILKALDLHNDPLSPEVRKRIEGALTDALAGLNKKDATAKKVVKRARAAKNQTARRGRVA